MVERSRKTKGGLQPAITFRIDGWTLSNDAKGFLKLSGPVSQLALEVTERVRRLRAAERKVVAALLEAVETGREPEAFVETSREVNGLRKISSRETQRRQVADYKEILVNLRKAKRGDVLPEYLVSGKGDPVLSELFSHALSLYQRRRDTRRAPRQDDATRPPTLAAYAAWMVEMIGTPEHKREMRPSDRFLRTCRNNLEAADKTLRRHR